MEQAPWVNKKCYISQKFTTVEFSERKEKIQNSTIQ